MDNKNKFNTVKIATCNDAHKAEAVNQLFERSLLFNRSDDICGIVISKNDEKQFIPISAIPDNVNIEKREGVVTLVENPVVDSITTKADHNGIDWKSQYKIAETSAERTIILLCTKNIENTTNIGVIGGEILEVGEGIYGHYKISLTPAGSGFLKGATTFEQKAALVSAKYNGTYYYGIKFKSTVPANIYFAGWGHFPDAASAPSYTSYNDADLSEIVELGDASGGGMTEAEKAEISAMINTNKNDIAALQISVAGKADAGHKHSASDITSGTLPVANGGTGVTTQADINKAFINNLEVGNSDVTDGTEFVSSYASDNGFAETAEGALNKPYKRQFIKVWNYIKGKISSVLGLTASSYGGKASTAGTADKVQDGNNVVQYKATSLNGYKIQDTQEKALYVEGRELADGDSGGIAITNDGVTAFGAGDTDGVFRVINEDNVSAGPVFKVMKDGQVYTTNVIHGSIDGSAATAGTADVANALAGRSGIANTDTFQNVMNNDGKWIITDLNPSWSGSLYSFHAGGSQSGLMFRIRGGSHDIRNIEVNYSIDSSRFAGPWTPLIGRIPTSAPSSPQDGDIWIQ